MGWLARLLRRGELAAATTNVASPYYQGAGSGVRFATLTAPRTGPNDPIIAAGATLADRAYALERNEPFIWRGINALCATMIGTGVQPESQVDDPKLQQAIHDLWDDWTDVADADGQTDWYGQQVLALRSVIMGGDAFGRLRPRRAEDGLPVPLQVQVLEAAMVPRDKNETAPNGNRIRAGIEQGALGQRLAYHMYREHPADIRMTFLLGPRTYETVRVSADRVLHVHEMSRPGQLRGEPRLARLILPASDFLAGEDALQQAWNIAAAMTGFVTMTHADFLPMQKVGETADTTGTVATTVKAGDFPVLRPGEEVTFAKAPEVGTTYDAATRLRLRRMAAGIGITYEALAQDLEGVTYSSIRAGNVQVWTECDQFIWQTLVPQWCRPTWLAWFEAAVQAEALPIRLRDFRADPRRFTRVVWNPPKRPWVDPLKDIQADIQGIEAGILSRDEVIRARGRTPEQVDRERVRARDRAAALGLPESRPTAATAMPAEPPMREDAMPGAPRRRGRAA